MREGLVAIYAMSAEPCWLVHTYFLNGHAMCHCLRRDDLPCCKFGMLEPESEACCMFMYPEGMC